MGNNTTIKVIAINLAFLIFAVGAAEMIAMQMEGKDDEENIVITAQDDELGWTAKKTLSLNIKPANFRFCIGATSWAFTMSPLATRLIHLN